MLSTGIIREMNTKKLSNSQLSFVGIGSFVFFSEINCNFAEKGSNFIMYRRVFDNSAMKKFRIIDLRSDTLVGLKKFHEIC